MIDQLDPALRRRFDEAASALNPSAQLLERARDRYRRRRTRSALLAGAAAVAATVVVAVAGPSWLADSTARPEVTIKDAGPAATTGAPEPSAEAVPSGGSLEVYGFTFVLPAGFQEKTRRSLDDPVKNGGTLILATDRAAPKGSVAADIELAVYKTHDAIAGVDDFFRDLQHPQISVAGHTAYLDGLDSVPNPCITLEPVAPAAGATPGDSGAEVTRSQHSCPPVPEGRQVGVSIALDDTTSLSILARGVPQDDVIAMLRSALV
jgi:hypothetical protein